MTAPKTCERCGARLDAEEICDCQKGVVNPTIEPSTEFVMGKSLEGLPSTIDFNFEALKLGLAQSLAHYDGLVVTEDDIKGAKEDRAKLNKLREALESKRKEVKKECMAPYNDFEAKVKELVALVDKPIFAIDTQLKGYEDRRRGEKRAAVMDIYNDVFGDGEMRGLLPFEKVWKDEWYNVGATQKKIRESMTDTMERVSSGLAALSTVESEFMEAVKIKYMENLSMTDALNERKRLQEEAERLRAFNARKEAMEKPASVAPEKKETPAQPTAEGTREPGGGAAVEEPHPVPEEEKLYVLRFECRINSANARELSDWLRDHNITFWRI